MVGEAAVLRTTLWQYLREQADAGQSKAIEDGRGLVQERRFPLARKIGRLLLEHRDGIVLDTWAAYWLGEIAETIGDCDRPAKRARFTGWTETFVRADHAHARERNQPSTAAEEARRTLAHAAEFTFQERPTIPDRMDVSGNGEPVVEGAVVVRVSGEGGGDSCTGFGTAEGRGCGGGGGGGDGDGDEQVVSFVVQPGQGSSVVGEAGGAGERRLGRVSRWVSAAGGGAVVVVEAGLGGVASVGVGVGVSVSVGVEAASTS